MADLYPLLLVPEFHERVWGTRDLRPIYTKVISHQPIGEAWVAGDNCKVANGPLAGRSLRELCQRFGTALVGANLRETNRFPLLIKFLFPRQRLSVQVHPDDEGAQALGEPCGKSECWYVVRAVAGASIGLGLTPGTTRQAFARAIQQGTAEELLNWLPLQTGEMYYIAAGTVHAIGPDSILIETQQNSDTTFRLYDYNRGRPLHVEQGLKALKEMTEAGRVEPVELSDRTRLISAPSFIVERFHLRAPRVLKREETGGAAQVLVASDGCGVVQWEGSETVVLQRGEAVVIPASLPQVQVQPQWELEMLLMRVPA